MDVHADIAMVRYNIYWDDTIQGHRSDCFRRFLYLHKKLQVTFINGDLNKATNTTKLNLLLFVIAALFLISVLLSRFA